MDWILDFCKGCGVLLAGDITQDDVCFNCHSPIKNRNERFQGVFPEQDGRGFVALILGEDP